jgi:LysR family transcriptional regulator of gallate degradation
MAVGLALEHNLRHLRVLLAVAQHGTITRAAELCCVSQPAVTQAIAKMERMAGGALFSRSSRGLFPTKLGEMLAVRVARAIGYLDNGTRPFSPRLAQRATFPQLHAVIAVRETENFTLAAGRLGISQPTVHRAVTMLERDAGLALFDRTSHGIIANQACQALATAAKLTFAELAQAETDLADATGRELGRIAVGAMPMACNYLLPNVIARFRETGRQMLIHVEEGRYVQLLGRLRRGDIDFLIGALRQTVPINDVVQKQLFEDRLAIVCRPGHPVAGNAKASLAELASYPWIVAPVGTPSRTSFEKFFKPLGNNAPKCLVEMGAIAPVCCLLEISNHLCCMPSAEARPKVLDGRLIKLPVEVELSARPIGITMRSTWLPTTAQQQFLELVGAVSAQSRLAQ